MSMAKNINQSARRDWIYNRNVKILVDNWLLVEDYQLDYRFTYTIDT